jgi:hypothetical protein
MTSRAWARDQKLLMFGESASLLGGQRWRFRHNDFGVFVGGHSGAPLGQAAVLRWSATWASFSAWCRVSLAACWAAMARRRAALALRTFAGA